MNQLIVNEQIARCYGIVLKETFQEFATGFILNVLSLRHVQKYLTTSIQNYFNEFPNHRKGKRNLLKFWLEK